MAPSTDQDAKEARQAKRKLAQALGKFIALVIVVVLVLLIERYCTVEVPPFGPGAKIVSIDGDTIRAANGAEYASSASTRRSCTKPAMRPMASPGCAAARPKPSSPRSSIGAT